ncbi:MAG TPA: hypothetical protein VMT46_03655 [Anaerolineaceae bacterium]|nr:hypothetical protein [Anaerolineaceae bacterium]
MTLHLVGVLTMALLLGGCGVFGPRPVVPTRVPTRSPNTPTVAPTHTAVPLVQPTALPVLSTPPNSGLSVQGPWLLAAGEKEVTVYNADSSGKLVVPIGSLLDGRSDLQSGRMPGGAWLALRTVKNVETRTGMELILFHLPDGQIHPLTPLFAQDQDSSTTNPVKEAVAAPGALLWSPESRYLAFVAALDGPNADVYLLDSQTNSLRRLSAGPKQAYPLAWTPDGNQLIYAEGSGCSGSGCQVDSVWIALADSGQPRKLYNAAESRDETVLGFWGWRQMIVYSEDAVGKYNIRRIDLDTGEEFSLYFGHFSSAAFDPTSLTAAWTVPGDLILNDFSRNAAGLDMISAGVPNFQFIRRGDWRHVVWLAETRSFALGSGQMEGTVLIHADGRSVSYPDENWWIHPPQPSPDGKLLAFIGGGSGIMKETTGLRVYDASGHHIQTFTMAPVEALAWTADGKALFFLSEDQIFFQPIGSRRAIIVDRQSDFDTTAPLVWLADSR